MKEDFTNNIIARLSNPQVRATVYEELPHIALVFDESDFSELIRHLLKYPDGVQAIKRKWKKILNNLEDSTEVFKQLCEIPEMSQLFIKNVPYLIDYGNIEDTGKIAFYLNNLEDGKEAIRQNFDGLLEYCFSHYDTIFCALLETPEGRALAKENFGVIKAEASLGEFLNFISSIKELDEFKEEYEKYGFWADLYDQIIKTDSKKSDFVFDEESEEVYLRGRDLKFLTLMDSKYSEEKQLILQRIAKGESFEFKSMGSTSVVMQVGDQIIKFGVGKTQFEVPYHPRIMMPYFRKKYEDGSFIEIYNMGDVENAKITDEELLKIYKELETSGIRWGDARKDNVLVLLKDNDLPHYIESDNFNVMGFLKDDRFPTTNHVALKKGDLVICDLDYLYTMDDPNYKEGLQDRVITDYLESQKNADER